MIAGTQAAIGAGGTAQTAGTFLTSTGVTIFIGTIITTVGTVATTVAYYQTSSAFVTAYTITAANLGSITTRITFGSSNTTTSFSQNEVFLTKPTSGTTTGSSAGVTTAQTTSTGTVSPIFGTSINTTITTTTAITISNISVTTTATSTASQWTIDAGIPAITSAGVISTVTTTGTAAISATTTITTTSVTPSWWGWSSEVGTVLIATANVGPQDLPAWLPLSSGTWGFWNFSYGAIMTLWPAPPTGSASPIARSLASAITNTTSIALLYSKTLIVFGTSSFTTTGTDTVAGVFSDSSDPLPSTSPMPLITMSVNITSFTTFTATSTATIQTPLNTTTHLTGGSASVLSNYATLLVTSLNISVLNGSVNGSISTTLTATTLTSGYTTASAATGIDATNRLISTYVITGPNLAVTTTTFTAQWFYDTSCPTVLYNGTSTTSSSTSKTNVQTFLTTESGFSSTLFTSINGFTHNLFASPYWVTAPISFLTATDQVGPSVFAAPGFASWQAMPSMQAFSPWTATAATYRMILAPTVIAALPFLAFESGGIGKTAPFAQAITSTASGVWAMAANPKTTIFTISTSSTGTAMPTSYTLATSFTSIASFTIASTWAGAGINYSYLIAFGTDMDQAGASIFVTSATAPAATSTTSFTGISLSGAVTDTFCESVGFTGSAVILGTWTSTYTLSIGASVSTGLSITTYNQTLTVTNPFTSAGGTFQFFPGAGGIPKYNSGAATLFACGAAISLAGPGTSTWSSADPNLFAVVIGANFTTTSSTTSSIGGLGSFAVYTMPGQASIITSPAFLVLAGQNRLVPAVSAGTNFWPPPSPFLVPNQLNQPASG